MIDRILQVAVSMWDAGTLVLGSGTGTYVWTMRSGRIKFIVRVSFTAEGCW